MCTHPADPFDADRVERIAGILPEDVTNVLDVGAGGGYILRRLKKKGLACYGVDISLEMLKRSGEDGVCAGDINKLPFADRAFDCAIAADVIEHIPEDSLADSVAELARVSKRYILISSPYKDAIDWPVSRCDRCGGEFNVYGHLRSVDRGLIEALFLSDRFEIVLSEVFGRKRDIRPPFLVHAGKRWGKAYSSESTVCPHCMNDSIRPPRRNPVQRCIGAGIYALFLCMDRVIPLAFKEGSQMVVLLKKK